MVCSDEKKIGEDLARVFEEAAAARDLRDIYVKLPFGYRKARRAAREWETKRSEFWSKVYGAFPEWEREELAYDPNRRVVLLGRKGREGRA